MRNNALDTFYIRSPRLNQLQILKELAGDPNLTQAELARRCELSVAMVNNYMKELSGLGWLQYHRKSAKNVSYHLTPAGHKQVEAVEAELLREMAERFAVSKSRIREHVLSRVAGTPERVVLVGCGDLAEITFHALESVGIGVVGVCDFESLNVGRFWCGRKILEVSQAAYLKPDAVVVADTVHLQEIYSSLKALAELGILVIPLGLVHEGHNGNGFGMVVPAAPEVDPAEVAG
ncbi:MAG: winged helix-turn-helix transcriptional regulator [Acidobacteriota bacterium]